MKYLLLRADDDGFLSRPARALWIEIAVSTAERNIRESRPARALWIEILEYEKNLVKTGSRPARALWIEIPAGRRNIDLPQSRPARALWIEILQCSLNPFRIQVEAREGLVD